MIYRDIFVNVYQNDTPSLLSRYIMAFYFQSQFYQYV